MKFEFDGVNTINDGYQIEIWREIEDFEGLYEVSNFGRVRSLDRLGDNGRLYKGIIKSLSNNGKGYFKVNLKLRGKQKNVYVHRAVAKAFIPNPENKKEVNHRDGDKSNNFENNLEWNTKIENVRHSFDNGFNPNAGAPLKVYVFDGDQTIVYKSFAELGKSIKKSPSWCTKRFEESDQFTYNGLTISRVELNLGTKVVYDVSNIGEITDGYHSIEELYYHRMILFAVIANNLGGENAWKSWKHHDGTMHDDYFIVGIETNQGDYSYHYHKDHWDMFDVLEIENAPEWDGHKPEDITRLFDLRKENEWF